MSLIRMFGNGKNKAGLFIGTVFFLFISTCLIIGYETADNPADLTLGSGMTAKELNGKGFDYYKKKMFNDAKVYFHAAVLKDENLAVAHYNLACVLSLLYGSREKIDLKDIYYHLDQSFMLESRWFKKAQKDADLISISNLKEYRDLMNENYNPYNHETVIPLDKIKRFFEPIMSSYENTIILGGYSDNGEPSMYIYSKNNKENQWKEETILWPDDDEPYSHLKAVGAFGNSIAAVIGGAHTAAFYILEKDKDGKWAFSPRLKKFTEDRFKEQYSVSIMGNTAIIGANRQIIDGKINDTGAVYIFKKNNGGNWIEEQIIHDENNRFGLFGQSVSLWQPYSAVNFYQSLVFIYENTSGNQWSNIQTIDTGITRDYYPLVISKNNLFVGEPGWEASEDVGGGITSGNAYVFQKDQTGRWNLIEKLSPDKKIPDASFGSVIGMCLDYLLIGSESSSYLYKKGQKGGCKLIKRFPLQNDKKYFPKTAVSISGRCLSIFSSDNNGRFKLYIYD